jgi:hypothetical protein
LGVIELKPVIRTASLVIEGATREAEVLIDGTVRGVVGSDGSFKVDDLSPAAHTLTLRKADYEDKQIPRTFAVGQPVRISGAEGQLTPFGILEFRITPPNASITYKRTEEAQARTAENGKNVHVRAGRYLVTATAGVNRERQATVTVEAGKALPIELTLPPPPSDDTKKAPPPAPPKQIVTKDHFRDPDSWTQDGAWWTHKGDAVSWLNNSQGTFVIQFLRQKSGLIKRTRRVEWVIEQGNSLNRIEYWFDFSNLDRRVIVAGKTESNRVKAPSGSASAESYTLQIEITPDRIVIKDMQGNELDRYQKPAGAAPFGRFGFKGDVALAIKRAD